MSLSTCENCGGHIPLGPRASNVCETCGAGVFTGPVMKGDFDEALDMPHPTETGRPCSTCRMIYGCVCVPPNTAIGSNPPTTTDKGDDNAPRP